MKDSPRHGGLARKSIIICVEAANAKGVLSSD